MSKEDEIVLAKKLAQIKEALSPENRYFTGLSVGHPPTDDECMMHYIEKGGSDDFRKRWESQQLTAA